MEALIVIFLGLMFAHFLADFAFQSDFMAMNKGKNYIVLIAHATIWTGCITLMALFIGLNIGLLDILLLLLVHTLADYLKANNVGIYKSLYPMGSGLLLDQTIHVIQIVVLMLMTL